MSPYKTSDLATGTLYMAIICFRYIQSWASMSHYISTTGPCIYSISECNKGVFSYGDQMHMLIMAARLPESYVSCVKDPSGCCVRSQASSLLRFGTAGSGISICSISA